MKRGMRLKTILTTLLLIWAGAASAQMWSGVNANREKYFIGEGTGATVEEADKMALAQLVSQISVNISVNTDITNDRKQSDGKVMSDNTLFKSSISTVAGAALANTEMLVLNPAPEARVARWIARAELDRLFEGRRTKFQSMIDAAQRAEEKGKVDVALRELYWALTLVKSMQHSNEESYDGHHLITWLPLEISRILSNVSATMVSRTDGEAVLRFTYKDKPVSSLDFCYNDGGFWSNLCSVKDGLGSIEVPTSDTSAKYDLAVEVAYRDQTDYDAELHTIMQASEEYPFKEAFFSVAAADVEPAPAIEATAGTASYGEKIASTTFSTMGAENFAAPPTTSDDKAQLYTSMLAGIEKAIRAKNSNGIADLLTPTARDIYRRLIGYGNARIIGTPQFTFSQFGNYVWARGMSMSFSFRNGSRRRFTEDIVFTFDTATDKICNIAFGLGATTTADMLSNKAIPAEARMLLTDFMENYQTAFALKRLDYIESIFSDDALIIVVNKLNPQLNGSPETGYKSRQQYESVRLSKQDYMDRLRNNFKYKEFINIRFNETWMSPYSSAPDVYGLQIEQDYYSSNYTDHGYLFLQINMMEPDKPRIQVRTWQPEPDPNFGLYSIDDFPIHSFD